MMCELSKVMWLDQRQYESTPVNVQTSKCVVTCQLYMVDRVQWDEAIAILSGIFKNEADRICVN